MEYVTIASTGDGTDFGDLVSVTHAQHPGGACNLTRGVFARGQSQVLDYISITNLGDAADFGDIMPSSGYSQGSGLSNGHGGLALTS